MSDQLIDTKLWAMDQKLDRVLEFQNDLKAHIMEDHRLFYGENGQNGLVGDVNELKQSRRFVNKCLAFIGALLAGSVGEGLWRIFR